MKMRREGRKESGETKEGKRKDIRIAKKNKRELTVKSTGGTQEMPPGNLSTQGHAPGASCLPLLIFPRPQG